MIILLTVSIYRCNGRLLVICKITISFVQKVFCFYCVYCHGPYFQLHYAEVDNLTIFFLVKLPLRNEFPAFGEFLGILKVISQGYD